MDVIDWIRRQVLKAKADDRDARMKKALQYLNRKADGKSLEFAAVAMAVIALLFCCYFIYQLLTAS